jgi:hypothetical protein
MSQQLKHPSGNPKRTEVEYMAKFNSGKQRNYFLNRPVESSSTPFSYDVGCTPNAFSNFAEDSRIYIDNIVSISNG